MTKEQVKQAKVHQLCCKASLNGMESFGEKRSFVKHLKVHHGKNGSSLWVSPERSAESMGSHRKHFAQHMEHLEKQLQ